MWNHGLVFIIDSWGPRGTKIVILKSFLQYLQQSYRTSGIIVRLRASPLLRLPKPSMASISILIQEFGHRPPSILLMLRLLYVLKVHVGAALKRRLQPSSLLGHFIIKHGLDQRVAALATYLALNFNLINQASRQLIFNLRAIKIFGWKR